MENMDENVVDVDSTKEVTGATPAIPIYCAKAGCVGD